MGSFVRRTPYQMYVGRSVRGSNGRNIFRAYRILIVTYVGQSALGDLGVEETIILKLTLMK